MQRLGPLPCARNDDCPLTLSSDCFTIRVDIIQRPLLHFDVEACSTATSTRGVWVVGDLELGSNQLHREVYLASLEQLQGRLVDDNLGRSLCGCCLSDFSRSVLKYCIVFAEG